MSASVGPRSLTRSQVEDPRPRPATPSRVNGCLGLALARGIFSLFFAWFARIGDPIRPLSRARSLSRPRPQKATKSFCRVTDPRGTSACPQSSPCSSALLSKRGTASGANGFVPETIRLRWCSRVEAIAAPALLRTLADPRSRDPRDLPRSEQHRHPRHRRMTTGTGSSPASPPPI